MKTKAQIKIEVKDYPAEEYFQMMKVGTSYEFFKQIMSKYARDMRF